MEFLFLASAHFLALLSPGPDFFLIMQASLRLPLRCGLAVCFGIALANGAYLLVAITGFEVVRDTVWLFTSLKFLGAAYLLFLGTMLLRSPKRTIDSREEDLFLHSESLSRQFFIGFSSAILNPKNIIFYLSLFTAMVSRDTGLTTRCLYGLWMMSVVFIWDCLLVILLCRNTVKNWLGRSVFYIEKIAGVSLACFGILLPFS